MMNHLIWAAGLIGHLVLLFVLFRRKLAGRFPWFTLLIVFYLVRSIGLVAALHVMGRPASSPATMVIDFADIVLQFAVLAELTSIGLRPLGRNRRITLPLLLLSSGVVIVLKLTPPGHTTLSLVLVLCHFLLSVLMVEWAIVLALLLRPMRMSWFSDVAVITLGFGIYSAVLLAGGGYFTTGREMRDYVFFSFFRVVVYLVVVVGWAVGLWLPPSASAAKAAPL
jgi:hypothetical protein